MGAFAILHEDPGVVAVDKPEGLATITERDPAAPSLHRQLEAERGERLFVVHRLDKEVSGVVLFARDAATHRALSMAFEQRRVHKTYAALAHGVLAEARGAIDAPIAQFGSGRMGVDARKGKPSRTEWEVVRRFAAHTLLDAHPITGRRHQLRVHFYAIGHPLVGDPRYGDKVEQARWARLMLHARAIRIERAGGALEIASALPESMQQVLASLSG